MRRRLPLAVAGWLITGVLATGAGVAVISGLSEPLTDGGLRPLSAAEVDEALRLTTPLPPTGGAVASTPGPASTPDPAVTPGPVVTAGPSATATSPVPTAAASPPGKSRAIGTPGGSLIARCENGLVTLRSWSPAQGFQADDVERGPGQRARVEFEAEETEVKVEVRCSADGTPVHRVHA
ncbi:hypothetical protein GCM10010517_12100 [Streptosporangium fragile]|uniref:Septum formation initiator n=1 Tax=Streptosporangium fragile TaxID=46186 RepID=A0ABN3VSZ3_9ACTN